MKTFKVYSKTYIYALFVMLYFLGTSFNGNAQTTITIGPPSTVPSTILLTSQYKYTRMAFIYDSYEINTSGIIDSIHFDITSFNDSIRPTKIYFKTVSENLLTTANWTDFTNNATLVFDDTIKFTDIGWQSIPIIPFSYYPNEHLLVLIEVDASDIYPNGGVTHSNSHELNNFNCLTWIDNYLEPNGVNSSSNNQRPNIQLSLSPLANCTGTPMVDTLPSYLKFCEDRPFNIDATGFSVGDGITYQWESSPHNSNTWSSIPNANTTRLDIDAPAIETDYRFKVTCTHSNQSITTNIMHYEPENNNNCYCIPISVGQSAGYSKIDNVTFAFVNNNTTYNVEGYSDYTTSIEPTPFQISSSFDIYLTMANTFSNRKGYVWIDFNDDGVFDASEMIINTSASYALPDSLILKTINIPNEPGIHRMRIKATTSQGNADPCTSSIINDYHDYLVEIVDSFPCPRPSNLVHHHDELTTNTTKISWDLPTNNTNILGYEYYITGETDYFYSPPMTHVAHGFVTDTFAHLTNLEPDHNYNPAVRAVCGPTNKSIWSIPTPFLTPCDPVPTPWFDDLESHDSSSTIGSCWRRTPNFSNNYVWRHNYYGSGSYTGSGPNNAHSGNHIFITNPTGSANAIDELFTPSLDITTLTNPILEFYFHMYGEGMGSLYVEVFDGYNWTLIDSIIGQQQTFQDDPWYKRTISLHDFNYADVIQIKFKAKRGATSSQQMALDDIAVIEGPALCAGLPNNLNITSTVDAFCPEMSFLLETPEILESGLNYLWQTKPSNQSSWSYLPDQTSTEVYEYQIYDSLIESTDYRLMLICTITDDTLISNTITIDLSPIEDCYCEPLYTNECLLPFNNNSVYISNVTLIGENNSIDNTSTCSPNAYGDYTNLPAADLIPGKTYTLSLSTEYPLPEQVRATAWIDYNNNGIFNDSERILIYGTTMLSGNTTHFDFKVPDNIDSGTYRMRIRFNYQTPTGNTYFDACEKIYAGEAEDYMINILCGEVDLGNNIDTCQGTVIKLDAGQYGDSYLWNNYTTNRFLTVNNPGTYHVTVTKRSCIISDTISINYRETPTAEKIKVVQIDDCKFIFSLENPENDVNYKWNFFDGLPLRTTPTVTQEFPGIGTYNVEVKVDNACGESITLTKEITCPYEDEEEDDDDDISIQEVKNKGLIKLYPNPTSNSIVIESQDLIIMNHLTIYNILGQKVMDKQLQKVQYKNIDVSHLPSGLYQIHIHTNQGITNLRVEVIR